MLMFIFLNEHTRLQAFSNIQQVTPDKYNVTRWTAKAGMCWGKKMLTFRGKLEKVQKDLSVHPCCWFRNESLNENNTDQVKIDVKMSFSV